MIELPEATIIARQISQDLAGKRIASGTRGNAPHKFAFYNHTPEEYAALLQGRTMGQATAYGSLILAAVEPDYTLVLGGGGERILHHADASTLPAKHQLLLRFEDGGCLTVNVSGWGAAQLFDPAELARHLSTGPGAGGRSPLGEDFTLAYVHELFDALEADDNRFLKYFVISKPGILGVGNGYLQDILFKAGLHPRRRALELSKGERRALHKATRDVIAQAVKLGGRDTERDLRNQPGRYVRILDSRNAGQPCPACGTPIEKIQFLGGASYFCPKCQS